MTEKRPGQGNVFKVLQFSPCPGQKDSGAVLESLPAPSHGIIFPFHHQRAQRLNVPWKNLFGHFRANFCIKSLVYFYSMQIRGADGKFNNAVIPVMP